MTNPASGDDFRRFLESASMGLNDQTPVTKAFIHTLKTRDSLRDQGGPGVTAETLVADLVGLISSFELRLRALEGD